MTTHDIAMWFAAKYRAKLADVGLIACVRQMRKQGIPPDVAARLLYGRQPERVSVHPLMNIGIADASRIAYEQARAMQNAYPQNQVLEGYAWQWAQWHGGIGGGL